MKTFTRFLTISALVTGLVAGSVTKANAGVILQTVNPAIGMIVALSGWTTVIMARTIETNHLGGFIFVLDENTNEVEFKNIEKPLAKKLGFTEYEYNSYNEELDRLNAALAEANSELKNAPKEGFDKLQKEAFDKLRKEVAPETFSAAQKILKASIK